MATADTTTVIVTTSAEQTRAAGRRLAAVLRPGDMIALQGELGSGKTCFVQGLAEGLQVGGRVASPTFIVMRNHPGATPLYHADAYRLSGPEELLDVGLDDWLAEGVVAVEWADQVLAALPDDYLLVDLCGEDDRRTLTLSARGPRSRALVEHVRQCEY